MSLFYAVSAKQIKIDILLAYLQQARVRMDLVRSRYLKQ